MGFSAPKPDPTITAEQNAEATQARGQRISLIQSQLDNEDQLRAQIYGSKQGLSQFGRTAQQGGGPLLASLFGGLS